MSGEAAFGRRRQAGSGWHRRSWSVLAALVVALGALTLLLAYTVRREAVVRRQLIVETHRGVAELVTARLLAELAEADRAIGAVPSDASASDVIAALAQVEAARPWFAPIVLVSRTVSNEPAPSAALAAGVSAASRLESAALFEAAEHEEFTSRAFAAAEGTYAKAALTAPTPVERLRALNGIGRVALKAGRSAAAATAYRSMAEDADTRLPAEARWAMLARSQLIECSPPNDAARAALDLYRFLIDYRYVLEPDEAEFHTDRATAVLTRTTAGPAEQTLLVQLNARRTLLASLDASLREGGPRRSDARAVRRVLNGPAASVAYVLRPDRLDVLLRAVLAGEGPWTALGVAVLDDRGGPLWSSVGRVPSDAVVANGPVGDVAHWRIATFPLEGSVATAAAREVRRYTIWMVLIFSAVAVALALAARSVSREVALARLRAEFVASVSHELKTPLSLIRMFAESLREGWVGDTQKPDYYEVITRESERLTDLIDNVLDFSRIEAGTRQYRFAPADLRDIVDSLLKRYAFHLKAAKVDLVIDRPDEPLLARVDRDAVEQVLVNLLSNAVKYMGHADRSPRRVTVSLSREGGRAALSVSDTGIGMSEQDRTRVFTRFYRAGDERVRSVAGSGLGLTLVRAHVEAHGGAVVVRSILDHGSTFTIDLPLIAEQAAS